MFEQLAGLVMPTRCSFNCVCHGWGTHTQMKCYAQGCLEGTWLKSCAGVSFLRQHEGLKIKMCVCGSLCMRCTCKLRLHMQRAYKHLSFSVHIRIYIIPFHPPRILVSGVGCVWSRSLKNTMDFFWKKSSWYAFIDISAYMHLESTTDIRWGWPAS